MTEISTLTDGNASEGYITSPNYPKAYSSNIDCRLTIQVTAGKRSYLRVLSADMPQKQDCSGDHLKIVTTTRPAQRVCQDDSVYDLGPGDVTLSFVSKYNRAYKGFVLYYKGTRPLLLYIIVCHQHNYIEVTQIQLNNHINCYCVLHK